MEETLKSVKKEARTQEMSDDLHEKSTVREYRNITRDFLGLVKENYVTSVQIGQFVFEEGSKMINSQIEQWYIAQQKQTQACTRSFEHLWKVYSEAVEFWDASTKFVDSEKNNGHKIASLPKDCLSEMIDNTHRFIEVTRSLLKWRM